MHRVLVVDDEIPVARSLERWLKRQGAEVFVVNDPYEFEAAVERSAPQLIICDYFMPGRNGVQVLGLAKQLAPQARRCLLSGSLFLLSPDDRQAIEPCLFMDKPWSSEQFAVALGLKTNEPR